MSDGDGFGPGFFLGLLLTVIVFSGVTCKGGCWQLPYVGEATDKQIARYSVADVRALDERILYFSELRDKIKGSWTEFSQP